MRVFLSGFMAAGKTTVGQSLARRLGSPFVDLDGSLERRQARSITEIFQTVGEEGFRDLEAAELAAAAEIEPVVVALGGGTLLRAANRHLVGTAGTLVWLDTPRSTILSRLDGGGGERPLAVDRERALELFDERAETYRDCDFRVRPGDDESPLEVAARIAERLPR